VGPILADERVKPYFAVFRAVAWAGRRDEAVLEVKWTMERAGRLHPSIGVRGQSSTTMVDPFTLDWARRLDWDRASDVARVD
jgi:hypothetical protein